jgi:hypothetical protein
MRDRITVQQDWSLQSKRKTRCGRGGENHREIVCLHRTHFGFLKTYSRQIFSTKTVSPSSLRGSTTGRARREARVRTRQCGPESKCHPMTAFGQPPSSSLACSLALSLLPLQRFKHTERVKKGDLSGRESNPALPRASNWNDRRMYYPIYYQRPVRWLRFCIINANRSKTMLHSESLCDVTSMVVSA